MSLNLEFSFDFFREQLYISKVVSEMQELLVKKVEFCST